MTPMRGWLNEPDAPPMYVYWMATVATGTDHCEELLASLEASTGPISVLSHSTLWSSPMK